MDVLIPIFVATYISIIALSPEIPKFWPPTKLILTPVYGPFTSSDTNPRSISCKECPTDGVTVGSGVYEHLSQIARMGMVTERPRQIRIDIDPVP